MSNSSIIGNAKNKIIKEFISDDAIIAAIEPTNINSNEELVNKYIFNFHQNPLTVNDAKTFITVQVHIPNQYSTSKVLASINVEIWIITDEKHMRVTNVPKVTENRNDYLSRLIDSKLNGASPFGIGTLKLKSNIEGSYQKNWLYRQMIFEVSDINASLCNLE